jgi:Sec-independent protein translocase protein TatA
MGHWIKSSLHIALVVAIVLFIASRVPAVGSILGVNSNG